MSKTATTTGYILAWYVIWASLLTAGVLWANSIAEWLQRQQISRSSEYPYMLAITAILAGGIGGLCLGLFTLARHHARRDFDGRFIMWYILTPWIGCLLGILACAFAQFGLIILRPLYGDGAYVAAALAWIVGFRQNDVMAIIRKIGDRILASSKRLE